MENYNKKSIWKWILLYVVIAAVAYGLIYYFFFNKNGNNYNFQNQVENNSETADWKTYKNDQYGFEIKYPYNYEEVGPVSGPVNGQVGFTFQDKSEKSDLDNTFSFNINPTSLSFAPEKIVSGPIATSVDGVPEQRYKIKWKWDDNKEYTSNYVEVKKGNSYYIFSEFGLKLDALPFEKILSTFKFTE